MDMVTKIVTVIGAVIGGASALSLMIGFNEFRRGLANDNPMDVDKGTMKMIMGGAMMIGAGVIAAYVVVQLNNIRF